MVRRQALAAGREPEGAGGGGHLQSRDVPGHAAVGGLDHAEVRLVSGLEVCLGGVEPVHARVERGANGLGRRVGAGLPIGVAAAAELDAAQADDRDGEAAQAKRTAIHAQAKRITLRMPSWASISSKPSFTSSRVSVWETNGATSMSPASERSTSSGT
jgi:hypothetical protein